MIAVIQCLCNEKILKCWAAQRLGALYAGINGMLRGNYHTDHDVIVARKLAYVMCGGDLSEQTFVTEQYLLDLEREAFLAFAAKGKHWKECKVF